jgi:hypothetical protein
MIWLIFHFDVLELRVATPFKKSDLQPTFLSLKRIRLLSHTAKLLVIVNFFNTDLKKSNFAVNN